MKVSAAHLVAFGLSPERTCARTHSHSQAGLSRTPSSRAPSSHLHQLHGSNPQVSLLSTYVCLVCVVHEHSTLHAAGQEQCFGEPCGHRACGAHVALDSCLAHACAHVDCSRRWGRALSPVIHSFDLPSLHRRKKSFKIPFFFTVTATI